MRLEDPAIRALRKVPFFSNLRPEDANSLVKQLQVRHYSPGHIIFHGGDPGGLLYVIVKGKVKISHYTPDGQEALLAILGTNDFFGELALLDDAPRSATVEAIEQTEALTLHRDAFMKRIREYPDFALHVLSTMAQHIRRLNTQISDIFFLDMPARLARTLLQLADQHGNEQPDGTILINLTLTQTDLAEMVGATRVSINKAIGRFRRDKWVKVQGRRVTILDRDALLNLIQISGGSIY